MQRLGVALVVLGALGAALPTGHAPAQGVSTTNAAQLCDPQPTRPAELKADATDAGNILDGELALGRYRLVMLPSDPTWTERLVNQDNWQAHYLDLAWTDVLRRRYLKTGDPGLLDRYAFLLRDFLADNPDPGHGATQFTWGDRVVGRRSEELACAVSVLGPLPWLIDGLHTHEQFLSHSGRPPAPSNHSLIGDTGLLSIGCVLGNRRDMALARQRSERLLKVAVDSQGVSNEGSYGFQYRNYAFWSQLRTRLRLCGQSLTRTWHRIALMPRFLAAATEPTGLADPFGDTVPGSRAPAFVRGVRPSSSTSFFRAGYMFSRSGLAVGPAAVNESMVSVRYGQSRREQPHGHQDAGNIEFFAFGTPLIDDSGLYSYGGGYWRRWVKSRYAHNVITVNGAPYRTAQRSPLLFEQATSAHTLITIAPPVIQGASWERTVLYSKRHHWLLVMDTVHQRHARVVTQRWNLPQGGAFTVTARRVDQIGPGPAVSIEWLGRAPGKLEVAEGRRGRGLGNTAGWRSNAFGQIAPSPTALAYREGHSLRFVTLIAARAAGALPSAVSVHGVRLTSSGVRATIVTPGGRERVALSARHFHVAT